MMCAAEMLTREDARDYELHVRHQEQRFRDVRYPDVAERVRALTETKPKEMV
jgi:hypothetical protein